MRPGAAFERRMKTAEPRLETIINPFLIPRLFPLMLVHHVAGMTFLWSCIEDALESLSEYSLESLVVVDVVLGASRRVTGA